MKTAKEYRHIAKEALSGNWGLAIGIMVVYSLILGAAGSTGIGGIIISGALVAGYAYTMVMLFRRGKLEFNDLFEGFRKPEFGATIGLCVKTAIFFLLWSLLLLIPGYIALYRYAMAPYILMDHPEMTGGEAITASKELMHGKKWKLFCIDLSFIGWNLLCIPTLGILSLWISPWMSATRAAFYEDIKTEVPGTKTESAVDVIANAEQF